MANEFSELNVCYLVEIYSSTKQLKSFSISFLVNEKNNLSIFELLDCYVQEALLQKAFDELIDNIKIYKYYSLQYE